MACAYATFTGRLGVRLATSGPGAIHLLNGLYDAKLDGAPVLALTGQTYHDVMGTSYQQEVDLLALYSRLGSGGAPLAELPPLRVGGVVRLAAERDRVGQRSGRARERRQDGEHGTEGDARDPSHRPLPRHRRSATIRRA